MKRQLFLSLLLTIFLFAGSKTTSYAQVSPTPGINYLDPTPNATFAVAYNVCPMPDSSTSSGIDSLPFILPFLLIGMGAGIYIGKKERFQNLIKP